MQDVREYLLDALGTYASLQRFTPRHAPAHAALRSAYLCALRDVCRLHAACGLPCARCDAYPELTMPVSAARVLMECLK